MANGIYQQAPTLQVTNTQNWLYVFPPLLAFLLPFGGPLLSYVIAGWTIASFFNYKNFSAQLLKNKTLIWVLPLYFLLTMVSVWSSQNKGEAFTSLEIKLSFVLMPYLLACFKYPLQIIQRTLMAFVSGCFFALLYLLLRATYFAVNGEIHYFFYSHFSAFLHASYFSMYLLLAIAIVLLYYAKWMQSSGTLLRMSWIYVGLFVLGIFLCSSKMGIICFFLEFPLLLAYRFKDRFSMKKSIVLLAFLFIASLGTVLLLPVTAERIHNMTSLSIDHIDKSASESTAVRVLIWQQCTQLMLERPVFGYGVADVNDQLYQSYEKAGLTGALSHHLNAHNQYFQTILGMGLPGFFLLLSVSLGLIFVAFRQKKPLLFFFAMSCFLNFMVESMLQTAAGVIFFAFLFVLLYLHEPDETWDWTST